MWDLKACRCCLSTKDKLERPSETIRRIYASLTGLEFQGGDGYPTYFCVECHAQLKKCLQFRRKSRRAYYVLQRFMVSKKQISRNDIITVNRRKNNLTSSIGNCKLSNIACYKYNEEEKAPETNVENEVKDDLSNLPSKTITAQEFYNEFFATNKSVKTIADEVDSKEDVKPKNDLEKYEPLRNGYVYVTTAIKSAEQLEEERLELERVLEDKVEEVTENAEPEQAPAPEIDLEDVFKDLVEDDKDSESEHEQVAEKPKTKRELKEERKKERLATQIEREKENRYNYIAKALPFCEMKPQNLEEQNENWKRRMQIEPYKSARAKCCICLSTFENVQMLMDHVKYHNRISSISTAVSCEVCKGKFENTDQHEKHFFETHLYSYECKVCNELFYDLNGFSSHYHGYHHTPKTIKSKFSVYTELLTIFDIKRLPAEEMPTNYLRIQTLQTKCDICHLNFSNAYALSRHAKRHDLSDIPAGGAVCDFCQSWFSSKKELSNHMERWHLYSYNCKMCKVVVYCRDEALKHRHKHTIKGRLDGEVQCEYCDLTTTSRSIDFHIFTHHYTSKYFLHCIACGRSSSSYLTFYKHQLQDHGKIMLPSLRIGEPDFVCKHCDVQFINQDAYYMHLLKHRHPEAADIPNSCTKCRVHFETEEEIKLHTRRCRSIGYPRNCVYCTEVLTSTAHSVKHYMTIHKDMSYHRLGPASNCLRYLLCETCGVSVKSSKLAQHRRIHLEGLLCCSLCSGLQFTTPRQLVLHVLKCHCDKPFICMICRNKFKQRSQCRDHILKTHAPVRPYKCPSCPLKFSHKDYLNEHNFKIHEVPMPGRGPSKKLRGVCTTYPHMQVDISLVPDNVINDVTFRICDYHDKNLTNLRDHTRFFLTQRTEDAPPPTALTEQHVETLKRKFKEEKFIKQKKAKNESVNEEQFTTELIYERQESDSEIVSSGVARSLGTIDEVVQDVKVESLPEEYQDFVEQVEEVLIDGSDIKIDGEDMYEVVETENGERYVVINNVMYKIEEEEEVIPQ